MPRFPVLHMIVELKWNLVLVLGLNRMLSVTLTLYFSMTNRESGLSALATALTGWAPLWGLHIESNRIPNILVTVEASMENLADWSY